MIWIEHSKGVKSKTIHGSRIINAHVTTMHCRLWMSKDMSPSVPSPTVVGYLAMPTINGEIMYITCHGLMRHSGILNLR